MNTLLLDQSTWDLCLDARGNIAVASNPYAVAQDVASSIKLFKAELYYDTEQGVPYFEAILGKYPSLEFMRAAFIKAGLTVPETTSISCHFDSLVNRGLKGQVQVKTSSGSVVAISV